MNIVDNDYVDGDLNKVIEDFIETNKDFIDSLTSLWTDVLFSLNDFWPQ